MKSKSTIAATVFVFLFLFEFYGIVKGAIVPPPWSDPEKNPCATLPGGWQLLYWPPLDKCFKIFQLGYPCPETMELSPVGSSKRSYKTGVTAECRCPPGTALSAVTNQCHKLFEKGPCNYGEYYAPLSEERGHKKSDKRWGTCRASKECLQNMVYWPKDHKCYTLLTRGPCTKGNLIVLNSDGIGECRCESVGDLREHYYEQEESCYEHFTKGPCQEGDLFLPGAKCDCYESLPHYNSNDDQCYELGTTGPCPPGHIFVIPDNTTKQGISGKCQCKEGYILWNDGICYRLYTRGPCEYSEILINSTSCVENPCTRGSLYLPDQNTCYKIGSQGPCSLTQVVVFDFTARPSVDGISFKGMCGCSGVITNLDQQCTGAEFDNQHNTCESSPGMVEIEGSCYKLYTRGPCGSGQWLEPIKDSKKVAVKAKCECRPGYTSYEAEGDIQGCFAPSVGLARYLNGNSYDWFKFQFKKLMSPSN